MKIVIAGDLCPNCELDENAFEEVNSVFKQADLRIVNFECALVKDKEKPILKEGPTLGCSYEQFQQLAKLPIDLLTLANNHTMDYGIEGLQNILDASAQMKINTVGGGLTLKEAQQVFYYRHENEVVAVVNCCECEFSVADEDEGGANPMDEVFVFQQIQKAKQSADFVMVIAHGGHEYYQLPSPRIQDLYRFFIDVGANLVVAHHPHCFSGMEKFHGGLIFYSLGNFCFCGNMKKHSIWHDGYLLEVDIDIKNNISNYQLIPYTQCLTNKNVVLKKEREATEFYATFKELSSIISDRNQLLDSYKAYLKTIERKTMTRLLPYSNRYLLALYKRGLFPSLLNKKTLLGRLNIIRCESHREVAIEILKYKIKRLKI